MRGLAPDVGLFARLEDGKIGIKLHTGIEQGDEVSIFFSERGGRPLDVWELLGVEAEDAVIFHVVDIEPDSVAGESVAIEIVVDGVDVLLAFVAPAALVVTESPSGRAGHFADEVLQFARDVSQGGAGDDEEIGLAVGATDPEDGGGRVVFDDGFPEEGIYRLGADE